MSDDTKLMKSDAMQWQCDGEVVLHLVAVVAFFDVLLQQPIAAARDLTVAVAVIVVAQVAIVAALAGAHKTVTAARLNAIAQAKISLLLVGVIARFIALITRLKVGSGHPVTTDRKLTFKAGVGVVIVAVIASL